jgi:hypothetical protein
MSSWRRQASGAIPRVVSMTPRIDHITIVTSVLVRSARIVPWR